MQKGSVEVYVRTDALALVGPNARFTGVQSPRAARGLTGDCTPTARDARGG